MQTGFPLSVIATVTATSTGASAAVGLPDTGSTLELQNGSNVTIYAVWGASPTATASGYPVLPGQAKTVTRSTATATGLAAFVVSGTGTLSITAGEGA